MSSYHKAKYYRSVEGCCICGVKSSSSRFTDSYKYENEFQRCFLLEEERGGDICNACVLIVKRYRDLPRETTKNWHHVVDCRSGPGHNNRKVMVPVVLKPNVKKRTREDEEEIFEKIMKKKVERKLKRRRVESEDSLEKVRMKRKDKSKVRRLKGVEQLQSNRVPRVEDADYWRSLVDCCSQGFVRHYGFMLRDDLYYSPSSLHKFNSSSTIMPQVPETFKATSSVFDPGTDSGKSFVDDDEDDVDSISFSTTVSPVPETHKVSSSSIFDTGTGGDIDSGKSFVDEDEDDTDSISFYSDSDSCLSKERKTTDLMLHTDDEGYFEKRLRNTIKQLTMALN